LKLSGFPIYSVPPSGETMRQTPNVFEVQERALEVLYHYAKFGGARISPAAGVAKNVEFLSVCLSVTLLDVKDCASDFAMNAFKYTETILMPLDRGRFVVVHPWSTF